MDEDPDLDVLNELLERIAIALESAAEGLNQLVQLQTALLGSVDPATAQTQPRSALDPELDDEL